MKLRWIGSLGAALALGLLTGACEKGQPEAAAQVRPAPMAGATGRIGDLETTLQALYETVNPAVVNIQVTAERQAGEAPRSPFGMPFPGAPEQGPGGPQFSYGSGSGFVYDEQGHVVTNNHVIAGASRVKVSFSDGREVDGEIVGTDPDSDLAVLKIDPEGLPAPVAMGDSTQVKVGELAVAIGNPFGLQSTLTVGFVSALGRLLPVDLNNPMGSYSIPDMIQTDASINPGNSGGVLLNRDGQVIGVTSAIISPAGASAGIGFAIPSAIVQKVVPALITDGRFEHPWIGFSGGDLNPDIAKAMELEAGQRGGLVVEVLTDSPADKAGIQGGSRVVEFDGIPIKVGGDVVIKIGDTDIREFDDIVTYLARSTKVGDTIKLTVLRDGKEQTIDLTLEPRPKRDQPQPVSLRQPGPAARPDEAAWLGIQGRDVEPAMRESLGLDAGQQGVLVAEVSEDSPAAAAGLRGAEGRGGDVIVAVDGHPVTRLDDLVEHIGEHKPGDQVSLGILRDGKPRTVKVELAAQPR